MSGSGLWPDPADLTSERALRDSEARFRALLQHSSDMVSVVARDGTLKFHFPPAVLGYEEGENWGKGIFAFLHPDDVEPALARFAEVMATPGSSPPFECRLRAADSSWHWLEVVGTNLLDEPAVEGVVLNSRDITERKEAEEALRRSEKRFRAMVQHGYDIITVVDPDGRVRYVSPSVRHLMGYDPEELVEEAGFDFVHSDDVNALAANFAKVTTAPGFHPAIEIRARHADGSWRWMELVHTNLIANPSVGGVVINIRDVTERKHAEEELAYRVLHDPLTQLPNRVLLLDRLEQALARSERDGSAVGVVFLDLDRFKLVNDTRGHPAGDQLLAAVAERLRGAIRSSDTVARFGGDEFVVLYERITDLDEVEQLGRELAAMLTLPFPVGDTEVFVTASLGVALGRVGDSPDALLRDADAAMYRAKDEGGARVRTFDEKLRLHAVARVETEVELRRALGRDEMRLAYQPLVSLRTGHVVGMEALLRWDHPERGVVGPSDFVGLAEETGLIVPIGAWVLERACRQLRRWQDLDDGSRLTMSVNLSAVQLREPDLPDLVTDVLAETGVDPATLTLEITETILMESEVFTDVLAKLKASGVRVAIDDFGTRYSSLGFLHRFPVDELKIDQSFTRRLADRPQGAAIVSAIVAMGRALGLAVIAEGVETADEARELVSLGCELAQGYHFARPLSEPAATELLMDRSRLQHVAHA